MTIPSQDLPNYCCADPKLQFEWAVGAVNDGIDGEIVRAISLEDVSCLTCGARYRFDTLNETSCSVIACAKDGRRIVLRVKVDAMTRQ